MTGYGIALKVACSRSAMVGIYRIAERASQVSANVLIMGESGVGKEHLARQIHRFRDPEGKGFRIYHCHASGIDVEEIKDLLWGKSEEQRADEPITVFMKSLEEVDKKHQLQLLELLEEEELLDLLHSQTSYPKPRLICSCLRDMATDSDRILQQKLAYRLDVIHIEIPPLRERREEILPLADLFLQEFKVKYGKSISRFSSRVREELSAYSWPGNVRELRNVVEEAVMLAKSDPIEMIYLN